MRNTAFNFLTNAIGLTVSPQKALVMEGPLKDAEADNHSKKDKIETDPSEGDKAEEGKRSEASQSKCSKLQSFIFKAWGFGHLGSLQKFFMSQVR